MGGGTLATAFPFQAEACLIPGQRSALPGAQACPLSGHAGGRNAKNGVNLAKRRGVSETVARRMLDPKHNTEPERIQAALAALSKRIVVRFEDAA